MNIIENFQNDLTAMQPVTYKTNDMKKRCKVLIVDDEVDLCILLKNYLSRKNFEVFIAHTLNEGLEILKNKNPDILFLDNNLPDGAGWDKVSLLALEYPDLRINLISAFHPSFPKLLTENINIIDKPISLKQIDKYIALSG